MGKTRLEKHIKRHLGLLMIKKTIDKEYNFVREQLNCETAMFIRKLVHKGLTKEKVMEEWAKINKKGTEDGYATFHEEMEKLRKAIGDDED